MSQTAILNANNNSGMTNTKPISPAFKAMGAHGIFSVPSPRRARCISCSEPNDLGLEPVEVKVTAEMPEVIVTRRSRTDSMCDRIMDDTTTGTVKYFCRSRGHGFVNPDEDPNEELFMHISDIEGEFVPKKGDRVSFRKCPLPPKFNKFQAVHVHILNLSPHSRRQRWESAETPEEAEENKLHSLPYDV